MRTIDSIIIHCSATKAGMDFSAMDIDRWHRARGFHEIGYHYVIRLDGSIEGGRSVALAGGHCVGWNERSIGICYIGGLGADGNPADTRTKAQKEALGGLIKELKLLYPINNVLGHRDTSPDLNGNGSVEPNEFIKACPCFDVKKWLVLGMLFVCSACGTSNSRISKQIETDSVALMNHSEREDIVHKIAQNTYKRQEEHVEQTVVTFEVDTVAVEASGGTRGHKMILSVMKSVIDRSTVAEQSVRANSSSVCADSSVVVRHSVVKMDSREEKQRLQNGGMWKLAAVAGLAGLCILLFKHFFRR